MVRALSSCGTRGSDVRANQFSLLAGASNSIPKDHNVVLKNVGKINTSEDANWSNVNFKSMDLTISKGSVFFEGCHFAQCRISVPANDETVIWLDKCSFESTDLYFAEFPWWTTPGEAKNPEAIDVPIGVWDLSRAVSAGARVLVGETKWELEYDDLVLFLEVAKKLRGTVQKGNFFRGAYAPQHKLLLPRLIQANVVTEDCSRQPHHLKWTETGRTLLRKIKTNPVGAQAEISQILS